MTELESIQRKGARTQRREEPTGEILASLRPCVHESPTTRLLLAAPAELAGAGGGRPNLRAQRQRAGKGQVPSLDSLIPATSLARTYCRRPTLV
jgi:hypothetical protein